MTASEFAVVGRDSPPAGHAVAAAFVAACRDLGRDPDPRLRLLSLADADTPVGQPVALRCPADLGALHEQLASADERRRRGAWYTPPWLAEELAADAVVDVGVVADPACGGGAFLLAAADRLRALGAEPGSIVAELVWGADIDLVAVAVAEAALWWWSADAGAPTVAGPRLVVGDALLDATVPPASAVVGNPPFLGQLKTSTAVDADRRTALQERWGPMVRPYTDAAWLFLAAAAQSVEPGGRVAMVQPQSLLGARDAQEIRSRLDEDFDLERCWVDDGTAFTAAVDVCAPVLRRRDPSTALSARADAPRRSWSASLADARGVPDARMPDHTPRLGDVATTFAGFRDEYYGLVPAVSEAAEVAGVTSATGAAEGPPGTLALVTSGDIDPLRRRGAPIRFAKRRWANPVIDIASVTPGRAARWVAVQRAPKLLVATQTRVVEAVVDVEGTLIGSVPAIAVVAGDPGRLWHLAAALHAPVASAWMMRRTAGTALAADACKPTAGLLAELPLPCDGDAWDEAAALAEELACGADRWDDFARTADAAYGVGDATAQTWWLDRLPVP